MVKSVMRLGAFMGYIGAAVGPSLKQILDLPNSESVTQVFQAHSDLQLHCDLYSEFMSVVDAADLTSGWDNRLGWMIPNPSSSLFCLQMRYKKP